jgi:hypothetical protein
MYATRGSKLLWVGLAVSFLSLTFFVEVAWAASPVGPLGREGWDVIRTAIIAWFLVYYRIHRQFKKEKATGIADWVERNIVELALISVLIPAFGLLVMALTRKFIST